jgi:hypothetical protein
MPEINIAEIFHGIERAQDRPLRRELMQAETARTRAGTEEIQQRTKHEQMVDSLAQELKLKKEELNTLNSYWFKVENKLEPTAAEHAVFWKGLGSNDYLKGKTLPEVQKIVEGAEGIRNNGLIKYAKQFQQANENKQGFVITRDQDPELFNHIDAQMGHLISQGTDRTGKQSQDKRVSKIIYDPNEATFSFGLDVKDSNGQIYPAGMSHGRDANPNAPIIKMPAGMFVSQNEALVRVGKEIQARRIALGDEKATQQWEQGKKDAGHAAGWYAVQDLLKRNPKASVDQQIATYSQAALQSGVLTQADITPVTKQMKEGKQPPKTTSTTLADIEKTHPDASPAELAKLLDEEKEKESKRKSREKVAGRVPTEKTQLITDAEGQSRLVDKSTGRSKLVTDESGQPVKGKRELSPSDILRQQQRETGKGGISEIVDLDDDIPEEEKEEFVDKASSADPKLTAKQAVVWAKKEFGIKTLPTGVPKGSKLLPQKSKAGNPVYKDSKGKLYEVRP